MAQTQGYENENEIWTPAGNPSIAARKRASEMFPSQGGFIGVMFEVKNPDTQGANLITKDALKEMKAFQDKIYELEYVNEDDSSVKIKYVDVCIKAGPACVMGKNPVTFATNQQGQVNIDQFSTDADLLTAVQSGKGSIYQGSGNIIEVDPIFGGTNPAQITQNEETGENDLKSSTVALMALPYQKRDYKEKDTNGFEVEFQDMAIKFTESSTLINVFVFSQAGIQESFSNDIQGDLSLVQISVMLVAVYTILFMGSFSPIHFRSAAAGITLLCVGLSYAGSSGLAYYVGGRSAGIH